MRIFMYLFMCILVGCNVGDSDDANDDELYFLLKKECRDAVLNNVNGRALVVSFNDISLAHELYEKADTLGTLQYEYYNQALDFITEVNELCFGNTFSKIPENQLMETNMNFIFSQGLKIEGVRMNNGDLEVYIQEDK